MYSTILIDGDILVYKAGFASEKTSYAIIQPSRDDIHFKFKKDALKHKCAFGGELLCNREVLPEPILCKIIDNLIQLTKDTLTCSDVRIILGSSEKTFRHEAAVTAPYKGNREEMKKPYHSENAREYLIDRYNATVCKGIEADDMLGILQGGMSNSVIASIDKDLLQIPGYHYNLNTKEVIHVRDPGKLWMRKMSGGKNELRGYGYKWFCAQMLLGDAVDNIKKPRRGLGDKAVFEMLNSLGEKQLLWKSIEAVYKEEGKDSRENATLLWIQRKENQTHEEYLNENNAG